MRRYRSLLAAAAMALACPSNPWAQGLDTPPLSTEDRQRRGMISAAERGDLSAINRLLIAGTPVDVRDEMGRTGLIAAIENDRVEAALLLIREGASVNAAALNHDTPWLLAGARGNTAALQSMAGLRDGRGPDLAKLNRFGGTALIPACQNGHVATVTFLLSLPIDVDHVNNLGWTCLLEAIVLGDGGPRYQAVVRAVLARGANPNLADKRGTTPLAHARARGQTVIATAIAQAGGR